MDNTDESTLFTELVRAADEQVQMTLEQLRKSQGEVASEAARATGHELETRLLEMKESLRQGHAESAAKASAQIEAAKLSISEVRHGVELANRLIAEQNALINRIYIGGLVAGIVIIAFLVVLLVR